MTVWERLALREGPAAMLERDVSSGRVAHAYLFAGAAGRLPFDTALSFGAALVCPDGGCGACEACERALHHAHPDVELVEPAGTQLLVDQVRDAVRAASRRPVVAARRVIIVDGADRMNPTAQNAFLKALEEPPPSTTIVLLAATPEALLETVRSRCRTVAFRAPPEKSVAELLGSTGVDPDEARNYARLGGGLERATTLAADPEARALRHELVERVLEPLGDPGDALEAAEWLAQRTRQIRERVASEHAEHAEEYKQWFSETKRTADDRLRREQRRAEQDALDAAFDDIASVLRDLILAHADPDARLINDDLRETIVERARALARGLEGDASLIACSMRVERCRRRLRANANVLLTLEEVFLSFYRLGARM